MYRAGGKQMSEGAPARKLHHLHRRKLEVTVQLLEKSLARMEELLREGGRQGVVDVVENTLSAAKRRDFAACFALQPHSLDIRQVLNAELSSAWVMLENCRPRRMKGYGVEFDEQQRSSLDDRVGELLAQVTEARGRLK